MNAQRCHKHNALVHDFFISYRVSTDSINSEKLAAHIDGKKRPDGNNFITYLDKNCLIQGKDWEDGFKYGINNSNVILLLISQGVIATMVGKARRGDEDNVLKEHRIALELLKQGRLIIPVFVASLSSTKARRDCYIKLNREAALRQFDVEADEATTERLQQAKAVILELFALPSFVNIEPDSISEQVPKILQLWYAEFVKKKSTNHKLNQFMTNAKKAVKQPSTLRSFFLYPSQSFRLTFIGALIGLFGFVFTLSLLFMPSKSKRHTDLKFGVALGNIVGIFILIIVSIVYCVQFFYVSNKVHCNACESVVLDLSQSAAQYYDGIPKINTYWEDCKCDDYDTTADCLSCVCAKLYVDCENGYAASVTLLVMVGLQLLLIMGTVLITHKFTKNESFSMSLSSYKV